MWILDWILSLGSKKEMVKDFGDGWHIKRVQLGQDYSPFYELYEGRELVNWGTNKEKLFARYKEIKENRKVWDSTDWR